jgi:(R,R)-butanediol dehydrogenase / meso-butanediol dehydrogenase / diacetyl reductase
MRAAVLHGRRDLRIETRPTPRAAAGEVVLAVGTVGLCGTDAAEYLHGPRMFPVDWRHPVTRHEGPMIIGHEFSGRVVAVGDAVDDSWLGRDVASCGAVFCGRCRQCLLGRTNLCSSYSGVGLHRDGALAEYVATPLQNCAPVDALGLSSDAAALGQPMSIAVHAHSRGRLGTGERAVVLGVGGIGAFLVYAIAATGHDVVAVDTSPSRRDLARRLGSRDALDAGCSADDVHAALGGPSEVVYEASGRAEALGFALSMLPAGGRLVAVGIQEGPVAIDVRRLTLAELELVGTNAMVRGRDLDEALALLAGRAQGWDDVAPEVIPLEDVAETLTLIGTGRSPAVKVLVDPRTADRRDADMGLARHGGAGR